MADAGDSSRERMSTFWVPSVASTGREGGRAAAPLAPPYLSAAYPGSSMDKKPRLSLPLFLSQQGNLQRYLQPLAPAIFP